MMIIQDEPTFNAESTTTMIADHNSIIRDDEINDLSTKLATSKASHDDAFKSPNKRKQVKPNRVANDDNRIPDDLTNGHSPSESLANAEQHSPSKQQEAYCNLCERSFCNKYFLKTHFAKKHGVLNAASPSNITEPSSPRSRSPSPEKPLPLIVNQKMSEDYCEICQKRFCNKYYLRKHKGECHGVYTDYIKSLQKSANESPVKSTPSRPTQVPAANSNMLLLNPFYLSTTGADSTEVSSSPPPSSLLAKSNLFPKLEPTSKASPPRTVRRCHVCQQEFRNKALLRMHINTFHPNDAHKKLPTTKPALTPPFSISPSNNLGFLQPYVDTTSPLAHKLVAGQAQQASYGILHDSYFCAKMADRVVCEICNKQVCNKYFLKTHKAKVHGIVNGTPANGHHDSTPPTMVTTSLSQSMPSTDTIKSPPIDNHHHDENNETADPTYQTLLQFMKAATAMSDSSGSSNPFLSLAATLAQNNLDDPQQPQPESDEDGDESDGHIDRFKRKRSSSQSSAASQKRRHSLHDTNGGLQPFLLESEDPKFAHTFVPCMVYLPVIRRVTQQVKINLRLKPILADASSS